MNDNDKHNLLRIKSSIDTCEYYINKVSKKKKQRLKDKWSEVDLFKLRFEELEKLWLNKCMITWNTITESMLQPYCFPHILNKNLYSKLRYHLNNIWLVSSIENHNKFDEYISNYKKHYWVINLENDIMKWVEVYKDILQFNNKDYVIQ